MNQTTPQPPATLGAYIRRTRERAGLSLRNLATITGISRPTLNRLELDQIVNPSPDLLHRLAEALELDSDNLFAFVGYRPRATLPSIAPYLRAKYQLPPGAMAEATQALQAILDRYDRAQRGKPPDGHRTARSTS